MYKFIYIYNSQELEMNFLRRSNVQSVGINLSQNPVRNKANAREETKISLENSSQQEHIPFRDVKHCGTNSVSGIPGIESRRNWKESDRNPGNS